MKNHLGISITLKARIGLAIAVLTGVLFMILRFREFPVGAGMDDAYYVELARSLAEGRGPVIHLNAVLPVWRPDIFPLGFPLLLSPIALLAGESLQLFKIIPLLAMAGMIPLCLVLARRFGLGWGPVLAGLFFLNPWAVAFAVRVFSDIPFAAVSLAAVLLFVRIADEERPGPIPVIALILVTSAAVMIRSIGLALPVAMVVALLWQRRWRQTLLLLVGVPLSLVPHALLSGTPGAGLITQAYTRQIFTREEAVISRIHLMGDNLVGYLKELPVVLLPVFGNPLENLAGRIGLSSAYSPLQLLTGLALLGGIMWGLWLLGRRNRSGARFLAIYLVIYGGVLLNFSGYPSGVQPRLLLPVLPIFLLALVEFLEQTRFPQGRSILWPGVILMLILGLVHNGYRAAVPMRAGMDASGVALIDPEMGAKWITENTEPTDVVMVKWPLRQHIHLLRPVVGYGTVGRAELDTRLERYGVDYIWLGPDRAGSNGTLKDVLNSAPGRFSKVHHDPESGVMIFKVQPSS